MLHRRRGLGRVSLREYRRAAYSIWEKSIKRAHGRGRIIQQRWKASQPWTLLFFVNRHRKISAPISQKKVGA